MNTSIKRTSTKAAVFDPVLQNALKQDGSRLLTGMPECQAVLLEETPVILCHGSDPTWLIEYLQSTPSLKNPIIRCDDPSFAKRICKALPHLKAKECTPWFWKEAKAPVLSGRLSFMPARKEDFPFIQANYDLASSEELLALIESGQIWIASANGKPAGFGGFHEEGSLGLLEIFKPYRKCGFGLETEQFLIGQALKRGLVPYCDVFNTNTISQSLQQKAGLQKGEPVWWITPDEGPF